MIGVSCYSFSEHREQQFSFFVKSFHLNGKSSSPLTILHGAESILYSMNEESICLTRSSIPGSPSVIWTLWHMRFIRLYKIGIYIISVTDREANHSHTVFTDIEFPLWIFFNPKLFTVYAYATPLVVILDEEYFLVAAFTYPFFHDGYSLL